MNIITDRPIINEATSNASGKRDARRQNRKNKRKDKEGFFSDSKKDIRKGKRTKRQEKRKAKKSARKLKLDKNSDGSITFTDFIPKLRKSKNPSTGELEITKKNPDGSIVKIAPRQVKEIDTGLAGKVLIDSEDVKNSEMVIENGEPVVKLKESEVEKVDFPDGSIGFARKNEVDGMSKGLKTGLIVGGSALVLGLITFLIVKSNKK